MLYYRCHSAVERNPRQMSGHDFFVEFQSVVRGYHVYKRVWTPVLGEHAPYAHCSNIPPIY